jgi:hypothetical protein
MELSKQTEHQRLGDIVSGTFTPVLAKHSKSCHFLQKVLPSLYAARVSAPIAGELVFYTDACGTQQTCIPLMGLSGYRPHSAHREARRM